MRRLRHSITGPVRRGLTGVLLLLLAAGGWAAAPTDAQLQPIHIRPELYLGWRQEQERPRIKKLPWLLEITIRGATPYNPAAAGPLKISTREEFVGINFGRAELSTPTAPADTVATNTPAAPLIELHSLDFAGQVVPEGANLINLRCHVSLRIIQGQRVETYKTLATLECRPGRETVLAEFPGLTLYLTAVWKGPVLIN